MNTDNFKALLNELDRHAESIDIRLRKPTAAETLKEGMPPSAIVVQMTVRKPLAIRQITHRFSFVSTGKTTIMEVIERVNETLGIALKQLYANTSGPNFSDPDKN